jgi:hypothetical protein
MIDNESVETNWDLGFIEFSRIYIQSSTLGLHQGENPFTPLLPFSWINPNPTDYLVNPHIFGSPSLIVVIYPPIWCE